MDELFFLQAKNRIAEVRGKQDFVVTFKFDSIEAPVTAGSES
jgi:hypothetical protein